MLSFQSWVFCSNRPRQQQAKLNFDSRTVFTSEGLQWDRSATLIIVSLNVKMDPLFWNPCVAACHTPRLYTACKVYAHTPSLLCFWSISVISLNYSATYWSGMYTTTFWSVSTRLNAEIYWDDAETDGDLMERKNSGFVWMWPKFKIKGPFTL